MCGAARIKAKPVGAVIQSILAIYNTIMFFIERANQIMALLESITASIANIAAGNLTQAANFIEQSLARSIPVLLGFLGRLAGLGGLSDKIREIITRVQGVVDGAIDRVIDWIVAQANRLFRGNREDNRNQQNPQQDAQVTRGLEAISSQERPFLDSGKITEQEAQQVATNVKSQHPVFREVRVVDGGDSWDYQYDAGERHRGRRDTAITQTPESGRVIQRADKDKDKLEHNIAPHGSQPSPRSPYQSHHIIQDEWAKNNFKDDGYSSSKAPAILLDATPGSNKHSITTNRQNARRDNRVAENKGKWSTTIEEEFENSESDLRAAGVPEDKIKEALDKARTYFQKWI
ncbi:MAG: hypothetical protein MUE53_09820 [Chitinophagales bacterium]|nr:hypothetical protein [Chitinophagales bacterium]